MGGPQIQLWKFTFYGFWFQAKEQWRIKCSGKCLGCYGVLAEMRADWKCFAEVFHLPSWAHKSGICMKCTATTDAYKDVACKFPRLTHWQFIERQLDLKRPVSTIYSVPLFQTSNFKLDWLHVVDLGVTPDCLGNCFHFLLPRLGKNASEQLSHLLLLIKQYYMEHDIKDGINNLTAGMVRASPSVSPKLKVKGAEARSWLGLQKLCVRSIAMNPKLWTVEWNGLWFIWTNAMIWACTETPSMLQTSKGLCNHFCCNTSLWKRPWEQTNFCGSWSQNFIWCLSWHRLGIVLQWTGITEMKRQEGHWPEWQGLVVACRILGVLAVDVCKGFVVTTMCPSCEKKQSCKFCSSRAVVKDVVGKARCPKKYEKYS